MKRIRILVTGAVQGVGFRYTTRAEAERIGVTGWVRSERVELQSPSAAGQDDVEGTARDELAQCCSTEDQLGTISVTHWAFDPAAPIDACATSQSEVQPPGPVTLMPNDLLPPSRPVSNPLLTTVV